MKIRMGFVSNSSSSSFTALGKEIDFKELEVQDVRNKKIYGFGEWFDSGQDVFDLDVDIYKYINEHIELLDKMFFVEVFWEGESGSVVKTEKLPPEFSVFTTEADYHYSENLDLFKENYEHYLKENRPEVKLSSRMRELPIDSDEALGLNENPYDRYQYGFGSAASTGIGDGGNVIQQSMEIDREEIRRRMQRMADRQIRRTRIGSSYQDMERMERAIDTNEVSLPIIEQVPEPEQPTEGG